MGGACLPSLTPASCLNWGSAEFCVSSFGITDLSGGQTISRATNMPSLTKAILGKRSCGADEANDDRFEAVNNGQKFSQHKRVKGKMTTNGVLEAAGSMGRARQNPATMIPVSENNSISKAAGRRAGKLVAHNTHEVYHQILPGPSVQGATTETTAEEELPWVEGSEEGTMWQCVNSVVQPQEAIISAMGGETEAAERGAFRIPKHFSKRHRGLLNATSDDWARGAIRELKCRLCPGAAFSNWEDFKRHCDLMKAHPLRVSFCGYCGDFFARMDLLAWHCKSRPPECLGVTPDEALVKCRETERVHGEFQQKLECCLRTNKEFGTPFAQTIKEMYLGSSKRGSRQQSRLKEPKSES